MYTYPEVSEIGALCCVLLSSRGRETRPFAAETPGRSRPVLGSRSPRGEAAQGRRAATPGHSALSPVTGSSPRLPAPSPSERGSRRRLRVAPGPATRVEGSRPVASCGRRGARVGHATAAGREPPLPCGTSRGRGPRRPLAGVCPSPGAVSFPECHSGGITRHATPPCWLSSLSRFLHVCARLRSSRPPSPGQCRWRVDRGLRAGRRALRERAGPRR